ncbi:MAG TPA: DoxX family protein [Vicinamibacterales bacterium]|jgi:hypothetical protein|nr:DoxX family protein [Vicinamibacterales bacterium]
MSVTRTSSVAFAADPAATTASSSALALRAGRVMYWLAVAFLTMDAVMKVLRVPAAVEGTMQLGYASSLIAPIGAIEVVFLVLYLMPRTAILGAVLWTGFLGGAVATHVRLGNPLFTHVLSPIYVAVLLWGALWLRDRRLRAVFAATR